MFVFLDFFAEARRVAASLAMARGTCESSFGSVEMALARSICLFAHEDNRSSLE